MTHEAVPGGGAPGLRALNALLGVPVPGSWNRSRNMGVTTTELAHDAGISPATAGHHVGILRKAGKAVLHSVTPLGPALLDGHSASRPRRLA
ncbi:DNA-binding transcriptional ArsR family regulator [Streptomyces umbrinus]|uniref:DNA-binding transcriptional ArsR family regulator n=1 Tax=Streptomyces umbrinus TaxID=67370 RepID=A0ABU0T155_9ACTN|nr:winged helix-turn-helix domain-containing protein [Streptomyces umbrinus]MDQ1029549.1 DNA-binding transcriptional ArsR family regulator [Streptomyces umbrinus]